MMIIPAIDIKNGKCVRLQQGRKDLETVFSNDPAAAAKKWEDQGAEMLHVIDLDGAFEKGVQNMDAIKKILEAVRIPIQVGGGVRTPGTIKRLVETGAARVIIGTEAVRNPDLVRNACKTYPNRIAVGIDARNGMAAIEGWTSTTAVRAVDLARTFEDAGVAAIIFTDIHRDGMQTGPNISETRTLARAVSTPVIASGGVSSLKDIENLLPLEKDGVRGVITGRAIYSGALDLREAVALSKRQSL